MKEIANVPADSGNSADGRTAIGNSTDKNANPPRLRAASISGKLSLPPVPDRVLLHAEFLTLSAVVLLPFCLLFFMVFLFQWQALRPWIFPVSVAACVAVPAIPAFRFGMQVTPYGLPIETDPEDGPVFLETAPVRRTPPESRPLMSLLLSVPSALSAFRWLRDPLAIFPAVTAGSLYCVAFETAVRRGQTPQTDAEFFWGLLPALATWLVVTALYATAGIGVGERMALRNGKRRRP